MSIFIQFALLGMGVGALYGLVSVGLIAVYRGSGVLNFAQGAIGMAGAYAYWELSVKHGVPVLVAGVIATGVSAALGAASEILIIGHLRKSSPLARVAATIGILIVLQSYAVVRYSDQITNLATPLPRDRVTIAGASLSVDRLWLVGIGVVLTAVCWAIYKFTMFGLATTAIAENERSGAIVGLSARTIAAANWAIGGGLAGIAAIFVSPIISLQPSSMTSLVLAAMAAALVGNFKSFPTAFGAGILIGVGQSLLERYTTVPGLATSLPFFVIVLLVMVKGRGLPLRDFFLQKLPSIGTGRIRWSRVAIAFAAGAGVILVADPRWNLAITVTLGVATVLLSLVVVAGYSGQISLAQYALAGFGAWITGRLVAGFGWPFEVAALVGVLGTVPLGVLFALPALRTRGIQLALVTFGLGSAVELMIFNNPDLIGGFQGTIVGNLSVFGIDVSRAAYPERYSLMCLIVFTVLALSVAALRRGRAGRRLIAVRTNERAAAALGVSVVEAKIYAFAVGSAIAAAGGILISFQYSVITYSSNFTSFNSLMALAWGFIGGIGYLAGPLLGAILAPGSLGAEFANEIFAGLSDYVGLISGGLLILLVLQNQDGMAAELMRQGKWLRARLPVANPQSRRSAPAAPALPDRIEPTRAVPRTLTVSGLTVRYGGVTAVDDVHLTVEPGKVVGLIGPNGAGKTSVIDALTGFTRAASGLTRLDGTDISTMSPVQRARSGISRSFQSLELFEDATVLDNLRVAFEPRDRISYLTDLFWPRRMAIPDEVALAIREFDLEDDLMRPVSALPYGRRRLVAIARAVAAQPSVLLLDEPAAGLEERESRELAELVGVLAKNWGIGVLVIEHDMDFVMSLCDQIVVIDFGRMIAEGTPAEVLANEEVIRVYLGEQAEEAVEEDMEVTGRG